MAKESPLTGTGKKAQKKVQKSQAVIAEEAAKDTLRKRHFNRVGRRKAEELLETKFRSGSVKDLVKDFGRIQKGLTPYFDKQKENQLAEFQQNVLPNITQAYGSGGGQSSSLKQALAAAGTNLQRQLSSDYQNLSLNLGQNLLGMRNQGEIARNTAQQQAVGLLTGQPINPQFSGAFNPKFVETGQGGSNVGGVASGLGNLAEGGGKAYLAYQLAQAAAAGSSLEIKENIRDYDKGLDTVRQLDVKQYDYTVNVPGHKTDRVGLIAEMVPKEFQLDIQDLKHVDTYGLICLLVNAVKELDQKVKSLETR